MLLVCLANHISTVKMNVAVNLPLLRATGLPFREKELRIVCRAFYILPKYGIVSERQ